MTTRKAALKPDKLDTSALLRMIAKSTDNGFPVPTVTLIDASSFYTVASLFDAGLIDLHSTAYGPMYTISERGRASLSA